MKDTKIQLQESVSREMTKRGFSSKSAEGSIDSATPAAALQRKKLADLKIDHNFVPSKSPAKKSSQGGSSKPKMKRPLRKAPPSSPQP